MPETSPVTALVLVDLQMDYFPGGAMALPGSEEAVTRAQTLLAWARGRALPVIHIEHHSLQPGATFFLPGTPGAAIHPAVAPLAGETVVRKHFPNSFRDTILKARLDAMGVTRLVLAGMMTHMCMDATTRAAFDLGYQCLLASDACAAPDLIWQSRTIPAGDVHAAFLAALGLVFAKVMPVKELIASLTAE